MLVALGALAVAAPRQIFPVCGMGRYAPAPGSPGGHHACQGTLQAETALGGMLMLIGLAPALWPRRKTGLAASLAAMVIAGLVIISPLHLTGLCRMSTMPCRAGTLPALVTLGIIIATTGVAGIFLARKAK